MSRLTKRYAKKHGGSVSKMVEGYLAEPAILPTGDTPVLRSVRGVLKKADLRDYKRYLAKKDRLANKP
jgi:hypothetical protein